MRPLILELLQWIAARPRTYPETMNAWRSNCPSQCVWEDACAGGLIEIGEAGTLDSAEVKLTPLGRSALAGSQNAAE